MFRIVIVGGPAEAYIEKCLDSVLSQDCPDWTACVVLDPVGDGTIKRAKLFTRYDRIKVIANKDQQFALPNIIRSINEQCPSDEDILVTLDADDWFSGPNSLSIVKRYYDRNPDILMTHGSWAPHPFKPTATNNQPYSIEDWVKGIRRVEWRGTHLRTFKYKVWKHIRDEDLRDSDGKYFEVAWDLAMMYPMIEMCGPERVKYVAERIYTYNQETPFNDYKKRIKEQMKTTDYIASKKPYIYVENL